jgi:protein transport protein SEC20
MPPIPYQQPTFSDPEITHSLSSLQQRQTYLSSSVIPNLAALPPSTPLNTQQRLSSELREDLDDFGRRVEGLEQLVEDLNSPKEREAGRAVVQRWADMYAGLKKDARNALLVSKKNIDQHAKAKRDELFGSAVLAQQQRQQQNNTDNEKTDDALMRTTATLTDALRRTEQRLRAELDRSTLSTQLLTSQTATLRQTSDAHGRLGGLLETSKGLITALERTDWLDRVLILGALGVFLLACAWIVKVRVFDRAVGIAFWWVRFMPSLGGAEDRLMEELERGARAVAAAGSTSSTLAGGTRTTLASAVSQTASSVLSEASATLTSSVDVETTVSRLKGEVEDTMLNSILSASVTSLTNLAKETLSRPTQKMASIFRDEL